MFSPGQALAQSKAAKGRGILKPGGSVCGVASYCVGAVKSSGYWV